MITFCPYFAKRFGLHESIVYEAVKEELKHAWIFKYGKFWVRLSRYVWVGQLFFLKESEYDQALENLIKYRVLDFKDEVYSLNETFCN